jgi:hypothetical protein
LNKIKNPISLFQEMGFCVLSHGCPLLIGW